METTTDETTTMEITTDETTTMEITTDETTTMGTKDSSKYIVIAIIIGTVSGTFGLIIIIIIFIILVKRLGNKRDNVKTTKQDNFNKTLEPTVNKSDTPEHMAMQHGKLWDHAANRPGNPGPLYIQNVDYDRRYKSGNPEHVSMRNEYHVDYNRRN
jgi:hypothetical protein